MDAHITDVLACCHCGGALRNFICTRCQTRYETHDGSLDLRLRRAKLVSVPFSLGTALHPENFQFGRLTPRVAEVEFPGNGWGLSRELLTYIPKSKAPHSLALDLGCGTGLHKRLCEHAGHTWIGLDYDPMYHAPILGDGHALPFADNSIEFVISMAVLEHIRNPFVLASEVLRVLKPGGLYIGTVSFLEPFHGDSYYHHTHRGTYNTLLSAGFHVEVVAPDHRWSGLRAQATMDGLFPKMPRAIATALVWPLEILSKAWWRLGGLVTERANDAARLAATTGAMQFVGRKP